MSSFLGVFTSPTKFRSCSVVIRTHKLHFFWGSRFVRRELFELYGVCRLSFINEHRLISQVHLRITTLGESLRSCHKRRSVVWSCPESSSLPLLYPPVPSTISSKARRHFTSRHWTKACRRRPRDACVFRAVPSFTSLLLPLFIHILDESSCHGKLRPA